MRKETISQFPITEYLDSICQTLKNSTSKTLVLTAETAAGKSTILPLALLEQFEGKILMTEPRRLAVLGVANRVSELCENPQSVGYKIHLESKITKETRLEVVTEGILVRQLQADPLLENYNVVVLDEFHERSINTDMALAFLKEALELRDDLFVIIMSATMDTKKLQNYLGGEAVVPVMQIPGRQFPVEISYDDKSTVPKAVMQVLRNGEKGDILVFLPGIADIRKAKEELETIVNEDVEILVLHSSISLEEQKKVISPRKEEDTKKRVILSSAIAETSLTVPNITCVIDSGFVRVNRMNISIGMENLSTEIESEFSAQQRTGRAGRLCAGKCIRLWFKGDARAKEQAPEILRADITGLVLECCDRGIFSANGIDWLDVPNKGAWQEAVKLLQRLGMLKNDSRITEKGKAALRLGIHPRLAGIAIDGFDGNKLCDEAVKLLLKYSEYNKSYKEIQNRFIADLERRLQLKETEISTANAPSAGMEKSLLVLAGYPDRLACRETAIGIEPAEYQFASGRKAKLQGGQTPLWIVAPQVMAGQCEGVIFEFEGISEEKLQEFVQNHAKSRVNCSFLNGKLKKSEEICYGEIVLSSKNIPASNEDYAAAWVNEVRKNGFEALPLDEKLEKFLLRVEFYRQEKLKNDGGQSLRQELQESVEEWLVPFLGSAGGGGSLSPQVVYDALYWFVDGAEVDRLVPEMLVLPNGRRCKVIYEKQNEVKPIIEIIIQRIFGCFETPEICGKKVLLRLLSPASRPLQVTEDLNGFWTGAWPEICKEMKGRYPKHNWDYKIVEKE